MLCAEGPWPLGGIGVGAVGESPPGWLARGARGGGGGLLSAAAAEGGRAGGRAASRSPASAAAAAPPPASAMGESPARGRGAAAGGT